MNTYKRNMRKKDNIYVLTTEPLTLEKKARKVLAMQRKGKKLIVPNDIAKQFKEKKR